MFRSFLNKLYILLIFFLLISCSSKKETETNNNDSKKTENSFTAKIKGVYTKSKNKVLDIKNYFTKSESTDKEKKSKKEIRKEKYIEDLKSKYFDYELALEFFKDTTNTKVLEKGGSIYRVIKSKIDDSGTIIHQYEYKDKFIYLYITDKHYYIYSFIINNNNQLECQSLRRIGNGFFKTKIHDITFINNKISKENYVGKCSTKFYKEKKEQYFSFSRKTNGDNVVKTFNLGPVKKF